ncbi:HAD-IB family hydrolase [Nocardia sp. NPDC006044]|uniref:HAD-IB family hydrolase n=1 Tax=Nocardia sp. NPDC006044 TaxID=3364306 RepID=UPI0036CDA0AF
MSEPDELDTVIRAIRNGPRGPEIGAFFDFDGTLFRGFRRARTSAIRRRPTPNDLMNSLLSGLSGRKTSARSRSTERLISATWRGRAAADFEQIEDRLFTRHIAGHLFPEAWHLIRAHRSAGHTVVIATAATRFQVSGFATALGIEHRVCTEPEIQNGRLTGEVHGLVVSGSHKADLVVEFATDNGIRLDKSHAYSNGAADIPLLRLVSHPIAINPDHALRSTAQRNSWRVLRFRDRCPLPLRAARTTLGLIGVAGAGVAAMLFSLKQSRRSGIDRMYNWVSTSGLRGAGMRVRIAGAEHALSPRPAVFVFNHQSQLDVLIVPYVLRGGITGVVTEKVRRYPILGPLLRYVGAVFVDTNSPAQARRSIEPLVDALTSGTSVAIAPEGQVSPTPELLPFKKGAFHLAVQAGVPIIPLVIHNSGRALWRSAVTVRPGRIDVTVLPPIDIGTWNPGELEANITALRDLYVETMTDPDRSIGDATETSAMK